MFGGRTVLRHGFSLSRDEDPNSPLSAIVSTETAARMSQGGNSVEFGNVSSDQEVQIAQAWAEEARIQNDLRDVGLM